MYTGIAVMPGVGKYVNTCTYHVLSQQIDSSKTTRLFLMKQLKQSHSISHMYVYTNRQRKTYTAVLALTPLPHCALRFQFGSVYSLLISGREANFLTNTKDIQISGTSSPGV